jgi:hypothetical protein
MSRNNLDVDNVLHAGAGADAGPRSLRP